MVGYLVSPVEDAPESEPCGPAVEVNGVRQDCDCGVWDNALDHADTLNLAEYDDRSEVFANGANWGVGWLRAIVGMFEAIRTRDRERCSSCGFDPWKSRHWNEEYDDCLYELTDGSIRCGPCADESRLGDVRVLQTSNTTETK